jgi:apolipoprotein N-acyltransferase
VATLAALKAIRFTAWGRYGAAAVAGLCLALSFPDPAFAGLAWMAPALMFLAAAGTRGWESFRVGYVAGLTHYLISLSWLLHIPVRGFPVLGWTALAAFLALFTAAWVWFVATGARDGATWVQRSWWALGGAAAWVALEMVLARVMGGFPWNFIGASQYRLLPLIQVASVAGVYGVSFLVVWCSLGLFSAGHEILRQPAQRYAWLGEIILPATALALVFGSGLRALREPTDGPETWRVTFVQPSIPQTLIWDTNENSNRFRQLLELTQAGLTNATDLVLWPEAAVPNMVRHDEAIRRAVTDLARSHRVWMIIGSDDAALRPGGTTADDVDYFNAAFLINPGGEIAASYRKNHLVMFGEYIPLARSLPFVRWLTPITGGFTPGTRPVTFELEREPRLPPEPGASLTETDPDTGTPDRLNVATLICYEDVFPHLVRRYVDDDTDFLVNLTNDGWFGESAAQRQHAASAVFRAVENGLPLLRCCNNGLTCWIDARGRIRDVFRDEHGSIHGTGILTAAVPRPAIRAVTQATVYRRLGDVFGWSCCGIAALGLARRVWPAARKPRRTGS